jgi:hypothetical protein
VTGPATATAALDTATRNDPDAIAARLARGAIVPRLVFLVVGARLAFAVITQAVAHAIAGVGGATDPLAASGGWWMVWGTAVDLACLALLVWFTRRERISLLEPGSGRGAASARTRAAAHRGAPPSHSDRPAADRAMASPAGFEPATSRLEGGCSVH